MTELTSYSGPRVSRANPAVKRLLAATFPDYTGRKIELRRWPERGMRLENYWDGGTRSYWQMIEVATGRVGTPTNDNPFQADAHAEVQLPAGWLAVEHSYFCGHDLGIRIYAPAAGAELAAGVAALTAGLPALEG